MPIATNLENLFEAQECCINLKLLKRLRFYHIINPNSPIIFKWNLYQFIFILFNTMTQFIIVFGMSDIFFMMKNTQSISVIDYLITIIPIIENYLNLFKLIVILFYADVIWDVMNVSRLNFFKSQQCYRARNILYKCRNEITKLSNFYSISFGIIATQWLFYPLISYYFITSENENTRVEIIYNYWYPLSTYTINKYFIIFYIVEMYIAICSIYNMLIPDVFIMNFCWVFCAQYNVLTEAYTNVITEVNNSQTETKCDRSELEDLKSIIIDEIHFTKKIKLLYLVLRPIILVFVACNTIVIIISAYSFIMIATSEKLFSILSLLKVGSSVVFISMQFFVYCNLLDKIYIAKESVNFGIYSCNWTKMSIQFKKLLLLTMQMNDANQLKIKASPKKIVNLQLFANVMTLSYNMISVLLKTTKIQYEQPK